MKNAPDEDGSQADKCMNKRYFYIAALSAALILGANSAWAGNAVTGPIAANDGRAAMPLLSRFLPHLNSGDNLLLSAAQPTSFRLGFVSTGSADGSDSFPAFLDRQHPLSRQFSTGVASLDYGNYYGASRLDLSRTSQAGLLPSLQQQEDSLALSLEAGVRHDDLNAGVLYAYRTNYSPLQPMAETGLAAYPMYIFTPSGGSALSLLGERSENHAVFLYLGYNLSRQLNLRGTLGLARTDIESDDKNLRLGEQSRRWGVDVAATYRLLDNLVYEAHLGYVSIDDAAPGAFNKAAGGDGEAVPHASGNAPASIYHIGSHIRMTF